MCKHLGQVKNIVSLEGFTPFKLPSGIAETRHIIRKLALRAKDALEAADLNTSESEEEDLKDTEV